MQIKKELINDCLRVSKLFWKFGIRIVYNCAVMYPWNLLFFTVFIVFSVYKQEFTAN